jgi:hypothetical protein
MAIHRIYMDTSVFGGYFDPPFEDASKALIQEVREGRTICVLSDLTLTELGPAPAQVRDLVANLPPETIEFVTLEAETVQLAEAYITAGVVPAGSRVDAQHIAIATVARVDIIVSWNFRHIVNLQRIRKFNGVNLLKGYPEMEIRSPIEILLKEEEDG